jgi:hypothetical protein
MNKPTNKEQTMGKTMMGLDVARLEANLAIEVVQFLADLLAAAELERTYRELAPEWKAEAW